LTSGTDALQLIRSGKKRIVRFDLVLAVNPEMLVLGGGAMS
jgi:hypothetical protein